MMVQLRASLEALVMQAWRDRWTELEWSVNLKAALAEDTSELSKLCGRGQYSSLRNTELYECMIQSRHRIGIVLRRQSFQNPVWFGRLGFSALPHSLSNLSGSLRSPSLPAGSYNFGLSIRRLRKPNLLASLNHDFLLGIEETEFIIRKKSYMYLWIR